MILSSNLGSMSSLFKVLAFFWDILCHLCFHSSFFLSAGFPHVIPRRQQLMQTKCIRLVFVGPEKTKLGGVAKAQKQTDDIASHCVVFFSTELR